jgi:hypothetical protein
MKFAEFCWKINGAAISLFCLPAEFCMISEFDMDFVFKVMSLVQVQKVVDGDYRLPTVPSSTDAV